MTSTAAAPLEFVIDRAGIAQLDRVRPMWNGMQEHHASIAARLARTWLFRSGDDSWARRRDSYERWLSKPGAFLLIACRGDSDVGYLFGHPVSGWTVLDTGEQIGEIESLTVHPDYRGEGIGGRLIDCAYDEFSALGIDTVALSVFAANPDAIRFYEAHGMVPATISYLGRTHRV